MIEKRIVWLTPIQYLPQRYTDWTAPDYLKNHPGSTITNSFLLRE